MDCLMQNRLLLTSSLIEHAATHSTPTPRSCRGYPRVRFAGALGVNCAITPSRSRTRWPNWVSRPVIGSAHSPGTATGTSPCTTAIRRRCGVAHVNPRLFPEQIAYIVNHAENRVMFFDITLAFLVETLAPQLKLCRTTSR